MIILETCKQQKIKAAVFDFDGTLSTLRCGWEQVMEPLMLEILYGDPPSAEQIEHVRTYIRTSTGIQTILQMKWICEQLALQDRPARSPWDYKAEYNRRLMEMVRERRQAAENGASERYLMKGAKAFLKALRENGTKLYAASGTDDADVKQEAKILGLDGFFEGIEGAKPLSEDCSKEATLTRLITENGGDGLLVVGDGPVEIRLGRSFGATAVGVAGSEADLYGFDPIKVRRLTDAGAHILVDCFENVNEILDFVQGGFNK